MQERRVEESQVGMTMDGVIDQLSLWMDEGARDGPTNMAVDEWLLETTKEPVLRVYEWQPDWGSFGYFVPARDAAVSLEGLKRVRRWTGGGIVDHRNDWTYTLVLPRGEALAEMKGAASYRVIHLALAEALRADGIKCEVAGERTASPGGECFKKSVEYDLLDERGRKIAGAGQRRTTSGLLHQGSLAMSGDGGLAKRLGDSLARVVKEVEMTADQAAIERLVVGRYATEEWRSRR